MTELELELPTEPTVPVEELDPWLDTATALTPPF